jgi:hypothetical protein
MEDLMRIWMNRDKHVTWTISGGARDAHPSAGGVMGKAWAIFPALSELIDNE